MPDSYPYLVGTHMCTPTRQGYEEDIILILFLSQKCDTISTYAKRNNNNKQLFFLVSLENKLFSCCVIGRQIYVIGRQLSVENKILSCCVFGGKIMPCCIIGRQVLEGIFGLLVYLEGISYLVI